VHKGCSSDEDMYEIINVIMRMIQASETDGTLNETVA